MTKRILFLVFSIGMCFSVSAQEDAFTVAGISDEMTKNPEQNKAWRMGQEKYSAKPKSAWELGVHAGHFFIDGDVDRTVPGGYGFGLHLRKAIHYVFSIRGDLFYGRASGSHRTTYGYGALQGVINIGNLLFHKDRNKWNWYVTLGVGLSSHSTKLDLLDSDGSIYDVSGINALGDFDTKAGRADRKEGLNNLYDGDFETNGFKKQGIFRLGDDTNIHVIWTGSMGISRKLSKRVNLGIEHQVMLADNDYLDGIKNRTALDQTNNADIPHYTNLRLAINLGNLDEMTEPLYWLNPLADCKDEEIYSPPGFDVSDKGVAMIPAPISEADVNAIVDNKAKAIMTTVNANAVKTGCGEWFLPMIHYDLDKYSIKPEFYGHLHHVANVMKMCPEVCVTAVGHTDVRNGNDYNRVLSYNRSKAAIDYLATNYGIDRSRIKLMYGGEESPLIGGNNSQSSHYMNRRVEFRVCQAGDYDMGRPEGAEAGTGGRSLNSGSTGSTYSGNKNSGY